MQYVDRANVVHVPLRKGDRYKCEEGRTEKSSANLSQGPTPLNYLFYSMGKTLHVDINTGFFGKEKARTFISSM